MNQIVVGMANSNISRSEYMPKPKFKRQFQRSLNDIDNFLGKKSIIPLHRY